MSSLDYLDLCRLCLVKDRVSVPIFEGEGDVRQIFLKIAACLPVKVAREDKLPKKICDDCVYKVELFYQFWNTTANAEKQLLQWLGEVSLENKQGYVTNVLNQSVMKQEQSSENRLDGNVMQQVGEHQNNMGMGMMDNMGLGIPMIISSANQQQITSVPMDTSGNSVQTVQAVPGPSTQTTHNQISQNQTSSAQQEDEEESSEDDENSDEECDGDEGLPVKEESEEDPSNRTIEPTTFVNVSLACDEAGPSGLQQQKISDIPEMSIAQPADGDPKSGRSPIAETTRGQDRNDRVPFQVTVPVSSLSARDSTPWKIEADCDVVDGVGTKAIVETEVDRGATAGKRTCDETSVDSTKTVLVPVRDPVTKQVRNILVPVEVKDESGMNIIKSVLIPVHGGDGLVSYEIKRVVVPIQPVLSGSQRRQSDARSGMNRNKWKEAGNKSAKEREERIRLEAEEQEKERIKNSAGDEAKTPEDTVEGVPAENVPRGDADQVDILDTLRTTCPFCQKRYKDVDEMQKHVSKVHKKPYNCDRCRKGYITDYALEEHQKTHEVTSFHQCSVCQLQYKTASGLKNHRTREHTNLQPNFMCDYCGKRFKLKLDLALHINRSHTNATHICRFCGMGVKNIAHHELKHGQAIKATPSTHCCKLCPRTFKARNSLENHLLLKHKDSQGGPDMLRTLCEKPFESRNDFYQHLHSQTEVRQHKCDVCGKVCANEENLRFHVTLHSQTFLCPHCGKVFSTNYSLKLHLRVHTGEQPYQCKECLKSFTRTTSLRVHELIHTGQRPYVCDICGRKFTQRSSMMVHRRKHPGNHPPPPPIVLSKRKNNEH